MSSQRAAVSATDLTKSFGDVTAIDGLSLTVEQGELFGVVGVVFYRRAGPRWEQQRV